MSLAVYDILPEAVWQSDTMISLAVYSVNTYDVIIAYVEFSSRCKQLLMIAVSYQRLNFCHMDLI